MSAKIIKNLTLIQITDTRLVIFFRIASPAAGGSKQKTISTEAADVRGSRKSFWILLRRGRYTDWLQQDWILSRING